MRRSSVITTIALTLAITASDAEAKLDLYVDKSTQQISILQNGSLLYVWPVSTGRDRFSTPNGIYTPERLERSWFSKAYYNSPMPHAIFFHNGYAIHGSYDIAKLGGPASHGCVRLHPQEAALLFAMVEREGPGNTTIMIGDGPSNPWGPQYRDPDDRFRAPYPGDGRIARGAYPPYPQMPPYSQMPEYSQISPYSQMSSRPQTSPYPQMSQYPQMSPYSQSPYSQMSPRPQRSPYSQMSAYPQVPSYPQTSPRPQMPPYYETDRYLGGPGPWRDDNGQFAMRGAYPASRSLAPYRDMTASVEPTNGPRFSNRVPMSGMPPQYRPPAPYRNAAASIEPTNGPRASNRPPMSGASAVNRPPAPRRDAEAPVESTTGPRGGSRPLTTIKFDPKCPTCSPNREPDEPSNRPASSSESVKSAPPASPPPDQEQPSAYKLLPKSHWAGAAWRWRLKPGQEAH